MSFGDWIALACFTLPLLGGLGSIIWWAATVYGHVKVTSGKIKEVGTEVKCNGGAIRKLQESLSSCLTQISDIANNHKSHVKECDEDREKIRELLKELK